MERKHRFLLETARSLYFQSKLPSQFWGECILCATYLINRVPTHSIGNETPYSRLYKEPPTLSSLRCFGCLCYVSTSSIHRTKFDARAESCVFVGYTSSQKSQKGYKVLNLATKQIFVSRNVVFHETHFLFHHSPHSDGVNESFFIPTHTSPSIDVDTGSLAHPEPSSDTHDHSASPFIPDNDHANSADSVDSAGSADSVFADNNFAESDADTSKVIDISTNVSDNISPPPLRRSARPHKPPVYLQSYQCHTSTTTPTTHWCNLVTHDSSVHPSPALCDIVEPKSYLLASTNPLWIKSMETEIQALHKNHTWDLVALPPGKKAIGSKWVFKVKLKPDGSLERCKARLVAKGFNQKYGVDYEETFSPVVKMGTIRILLALAASKQWPIYQLDVNNVFLHGDLVEEVYMRVPEGIPNPLNLVCLLRKSIYGLKQASRVWNDRLVLELINQGFEQSKNDNSLFVKKQSGRICIAAVYVDDVILTGTDSAAITSLKDHLHQLFSIKDLGRLHYFLGYEVDYVDSGIILSQRKFAKDLLSGSGLDVSKKAVSPLPLHLKLSKTEGDVLQNPEHYRSLVGKLNYLTNTRPDLSYTVQALSQFMNAPRSSHLVALHHTLRYLASTSNQGILLRATHTLKLQAFSDADWASCPDSRRSITGYVLLLGQSPVTWKSKKQPTVSKSSSEAEYRAMAAAASEVTWAVRLLADLDVTNLKPVTLHCDNQSALYIAKNPVFHERTKHIELDCHFTRDKVLEGLIQLTYLPTTSQLADAFTKVAPSPQFNSLLYKLGLSQVAPTPNLRDAVESDADTSITPG